jgi:hypothetical protein
MLKLSAVGLLLALNVMAAHAAEEKAQVLFYRYVDDKGGTVLDRQGVPPEYVGKGYQVLNERGRVLKVVPPAPTADELQRQQADRAQAEANAQLLHQYSSVEDVDRAKARKLAEIDTLIAVAQGNLQNLGTQQSTLQGQAADQERAGRAVPQALLDQMNGLREDQSHLRAEILHDQELRKQAEAGFAQDRVRVQQLLH